MPNNPTGIWVYDYTVQPENGGLGVFAHEFGHDLGLPDLYDTSGNTGGAENNTAFWTLMSSGANIGDGGPDGIGDAPTDMGAWERLQLGWLEAQGDQGPFYNVIQPGERKTVQLGPNTPNTKKPSALISLLPDKDQLIDIGAPFAGSWMFWSGQGNDLENTMTHAVTGGGSAHGQGALRDRGRTGTTPTSRPRRTAPPGRRAVEPLHRRPDPNGAERVGITGTTNGAWVDLTATVPAGTTAIRFRYSTDPAVVGVGPPGRQRDPGRSVHRHRRDRRRGLEVRRLQPASSSRRS